MSDPEGSRLDLSQVLERFPEDAGRIRRLVLADESFSDMCEDYTVARETLARLEKSEQVEGHAEQIADFDALVVDLEREISAALRRTG